MAWLSPAQADMAVSVKSGEALSGTGHFLFGAAISWLPSFFSQRTVDLTFEYSGSTSSSAAFHINWDALLFSAHYRVPLTATVRPYIGGGGGIYILNGRRVNPLPNYNYATVSDHEVTSGFHGDVGIDYHLSSHWIIGLEGRYAFVQATTTERLFGSSPIPSSTSRDLDLSYGAITAALRFLF